MFLSLSLSLSEKSMFPNFIYYLDSAQSQGKPKRKKKLTTEPSSTESTFPSFFPFILFYFRTLI
jgi:hypothetical protein